MAQDLGMPQIELSAEDRYALVDFSLPTEAVPKPELGENLGLAMQGASSEWEFIWDLRRAVLYTDVIESLVLAVDAAAMDRRTRPTILIDPDRYEMLEHGTGDDLEFVLSRLRHLAPRIIPAHEKPLPAASVDLGSFDEVADELHISFDGYRESYFASASELGVLREGPVEHSPDIKHVDGWSKQLEGLFEEDDWLRGFVEQRSQLLKNALARVASNSLLTQLAIFSDEGRLLVMPYHGASVSQVPDRRDDLVLIRPSRASGAERRRFAAAIAQLETLLNDADTSERTIERLLRANPLFLRGLNYRNVYHQVVLPRAGAANLIPDVIAEPVDSEWADIIDLKLPSQKVLVGPDNRASLAHALHKAAAQLREYGSYFDDRRLAQRVEEIYGFRCYKPRLVMIVGRDPQRWTNEEQRRAMTPYPGLELVTYDRLLAAARQTLLL